MFTYVNIFYFRFYHFVVLWYLCVRFFSFCVQINLFHSHSHSHSHIVVRMLMFWYSKQEVCIIWGTKMSSYFNISNGVRQGGILSPSLFAIYMDDLSSLLNTSRIGCHISDVCINHVFYTDDLCLMALVQ